MQFAVLLLVFIGYVISESVFNECFDSSGYSVCIDIVAQDSECSGYIADVSVAGVVVESVDMSFAMLVDYLTSLGDGVIDSDNPVVICEQVEVSVLTLEACLNLTSFGYSVNDHALTGCAHFTIERMDMDIDIGCFSLDDCELLGCGSGDCNGHGTCSNYGLCDCDSDYTGFYCDLQITDDNCFPGGACIFVSTPDECESFDISFTYEDTDVVQSINTNQMDVIQYQCITYEDICTLCTKFYLAADNKFSICGDYTMTCADVQLNSYTICKDVFALTDDCESTNSPDTGSDTVDTTGSEIVLISQCFDTIPYCITGSQDECLFLDFDLHNDVSSTKHRLSILDTLETYIHTSDSVLTECSSIEIDNYEKCTYCKEITEVVIDQEKNLHVCAKSVIKCGGEVIDSLDHGCLTINSCDHLDCEKYQCNLRGECTATGICLCEDFYHDPFCNLKQSGRCLSSSYLHGDMCIEATSSNCNDMDIKVTYDGISIQTTTLKADNLHSITLFDCLVSPILDGCLICPFSDFSICDDQLFSEMYLKIKCDDEIVGTINLDKFALLKSTELLCDQETPPCQDSLITSETSPIPSDKKILITVVIIASLLLLAIFAAIIINKLRHNQPSYPSYNTEEEALNQSIHLSSSTFD